MLLYTLILIVKLALVASKVHQLDSTNFKQTLTEFPEIFVDFYSSNCKHCQALEP